MTWTPNEPRPEIPDPWRPHREPPTRFFPVSVPTVGEPTSTPQEWLARRRRVLVAGDLDRAAVSDLCAQLMMFDGDSDKDVDLVVTGRGGPMRDVHALLDVIGLMRARVNTECVGSVMGTAAILVVCGTGRRRAAPSTALSLRLGAVETAHGSVEDVVRSVDDFRSVRARLIATVAERSALSEDDVAAEFDRGAVRSANEACEVGLIDIIADVDRTEST